jgi:hypothetical protein
MTPVLPLIVATATAAAPLDLDACQNRLDACWTRVVVLQTSWSSSDGEVMRPRAEPFDPVPVIAGATVGVVAGICVGYLLRALTDDGGR